MWMEGKVKEREEGVTKLKEKPITVETAEKLKGLNVKELVEGMAMFNEMARKMGFTNRELLLMYIQKQLDSLKMDHNKLIEDHSKLFEDHSMIVNKLSTVQSSTLNELRKIIEKIPKEKRKSGYAKPLERRAMEKLEEIRGIATKSLVYNTVAKFDRPCRFSEIFKESKLGSRSTVSKYLKDLVKEGKIIKSGVGKSVRYEIK